MMWGGQKVYKGRVLILLYRVKPMELKQESKKEKVEKLQEKYVGESYSSGDYRFTVTEIGVSEFGHMADKGEIYSTIEYDDGYVCHPSIGALKAQIEGYKAS